MGSAAGGIGLGLMGAGGALGTYGQIMSGKSQSDYYSYLSGVSKMNAELATARGESEVKTLGAQQMEGVKAVHERERQTIGAQKVALASGGAGVGSKTAEQLVGDTENKTNLDEMALRYNTELKMKNARIGAESQAMNYESQAAGYTAAGRNAINASKIGAFSTLLGTGGQVASGWYNMYGGGYKPYSLDGR